MSNTGKLSVIISTYNRCESLKRVLNDLLENRDADGWSHEVIVVDNNSADATQQVVESYLEKFNSRLKYVYEPNQGLNFARNRGLNESEGTVVAYTDDDVLVSKDWVSSIEELFGEHDCDAVGGRVLPVFPENSPWWAKKYLKILTGAILVHDYGEGAMHYDPGKMNQFVGANMIFKKSIFERCGNFNTDIGLGRGTIGDDTELFNRMRKQGVEICYCGKILIRHPVERHRMTLRFIAKWNKDLGKYFVVKEGSESDTDIVYYFKIPRYLISRIGKNGLKLLGSVFNMGHFLKLWSMVFRDIGMVIQYHKEHKESHE